MKALVGRADHIPMIGERTLEGFEIRLRSEGPGRFFGAAFLSVWLCGWALGEAFALWFLFHGATAVVTGTPLNSGGAPLDPLAALGIAAFLIVWLTLWTFGGIAAIGALLSLLWGEDRLRVSGGALAVTWTRGPFRKSREWARDTIQGLALEGREGRLVLVSGRKRVVLSALGTREQRGEAAAALRRELVTGETPVPEVVLPEAWEEVITPEGERVLVPNLGTRRLQAKVASAITLVVAGAAFAAAWFGGADPRRLVPALGLTLVAIGLAAGTLWLVRGRNEWKVGGGRLTLRRRYGPSVRELFEARRLALEISTDSDGDEWHELVALGAGDEPAAPAAAVWGARPANRRTVVRLMNDRESVANLGAWLARAADVPFEDRTTPEAKKLEFEKMRALLEESGPLGRWAGQLVDRMSEGRRRTG